VGTIITTLQHYNENYPSFLKGLQKIKQMWEYDSCRKVIYTSDIKGPEKLNDTCVKTMNEGTVDRGFTVACSHGTMHAIKGTVTDLLGQPIHSIQKM
jgi:hypothetical protein